MFYHDKQLQYKVEIEKPNPHFARALQQAIGGVEGEMRVCLQYLFQAWNYRGPRKYRDLLLETGTEEIAHIEMLCTAVALNLSDAPTESRQPMAMHPLAGTKMAGMDLRHILSAGLGALPSDANGVPFNGSWIVSSGNIAADMYSNIAAESTGRVLATRLYEMTDDAGMKDMLSFLIARDTMHQNQWLAVLAEMEDVHPIPNSFPQNLENQDVNYTFFSTYRDHEPIPEGSWTHGRSVDGKGEFRSRHIEPMGEEPVLDPPRPETHAQNEQMEVADMHH